MFRRLVHYRWSLTNVLMRQCQTGRSASHYRIASADWRPASSDRFQELQMRQYLPHRQPADFLRCPSEGLGEKKRGLRQRVLDGTGYLLVGCRDPADIV